MADDHQAILDAVTQYVEQAEDIEIVGTAADGIEALRLIEERRPDVAVLDIRMPNLSGIEVLERLAGTEASLPVILYTGYPERSLLLEALESGNDGEPGVGDNLLRGRLCRDVEASDPQQGSSVLVDERHEGGLVARAQQGEELGVLVWGKCRGRAPTITASACRTSSVAR